MSKLTIRHDLHTLTQQEAMQYLRDVSTFLELDPDLNAFDLIWMPNPSGEGKTLCVYARRGTCELLRDKHEIEIIDQTETVIAGSYVVRVKGRNGKGRVEIALGSRSIEDLKGRDRDDAIMTASTRALQRLTMQFTGLGILSESEVISVIAPPANPASGAQLAGSAMVIPPMPSVAPNNAPGKPSEPSNMIAPSQDPKTQAQVAAVIAIRDSEKAVIPADAETAPKAETPAESTTSPALEAAPEAVKKPRKPRKSNTVTLDVEPEIVNKSANADIPGSQPSATPALVPTQVSSAVPIQGLNVPAQISTPTSSQDIPVSPATTKEPEQGASGNGLGIAPALAGMPSVEQMADYRLRISVFTKELPPSKNGEYGSVQRMRAFITKWNNGVPPSALSVAQWEAQIAWFQEFTQKNGIKGLIQYIGDTLGDNK
jgi:hypothetical protein